jgi:hypothetical protein
LCACIAARDTLFWTVGRRADRQDAADHENTQRHGADPYPNNRLAAEAIDAMIRFLFRFVGLLILATAFVLLIYDGTRSIAANAVIVTKTGELWFNIHQNSLQLLQPAIERYVGDWLWQSVIQPFILEQPAWLVLGVLATLLILLGRRKKPLIGYARD